MDLQELASELNNFDTETFEVKDYIDYAEMAFGSTCSQNMAVDVEQPPWPIGKEPS